MERGLIEKAARLIAEATYAIALTGAGVSTPSGIPDFRSPGSGLWTQVDPMEVASIQAFYRDPEAWYKWYHERGTMFLDAQPNPAHEALAELEEMGRLQAVITQNIDNLHQKAGSKRVIELHGNTREAICLRCGDIIPARLLWERYVQERQAPRCEKCSGMMKPNVILFGELLPEEALSAAWEETDECDLMLVAGSSLEVTPAAHLPLMARRRGAKLVVVNFQPTPADSYAEVAIREDVAEVLPKIAEICREKI
jgi:NAD-dependent deacetylase